jgi:hypothetical protein
MPQALSLSAFQQRVLTVPEQWDVFLGGGRGGGKSYALLLLALRHIEQYGDRARVLYLRQTYKGIADFELTCRELFGLVYGTDARYNAGEHVWRMPNGAVLELGQLESPSEFAKYQGRSATLLLIDEGGQWATPDTLDLMRSNLRAPKGIAIRVVIAANPGGPGHHWIARRYVFRSAPWTPFVEPTSKRTWVYCPSTVTDNEFIDRAAYRDQLSSACAHDTELLRAWVDGDWAVARGAFFADAIDERRNAVEPWSAIPRGWETYLAHDFGSAAPSVTFIVAVSPGAQHLGRAYARGSLVLVDELAAVHRSDLNRGLGWTAATTGEAIREMCSRWKVSPKGVADDACFAKTGHGATIAEEFARVGVRFQAAKKADRITGWTLMRRLLSHAGQPDVPGLYASRACSYFWATVPYLARDQKRIEDVDSSGPDHAADAARYACLRLRRSAEFFELDL